MGSVNHFECLFSRELNQSVNIFIRQVNISKCSQKIDFTKHKFLCLVLLFMSLLVKYEENHLRKCKGIGNSPVYFPPSDNFSTKCYTN